MRGRRAACLPRRRCKIACGIAPTHFPPSTHARLPPDETMFPHRSIVLSTKSKALRFLSQRKPTRRSTPARRSVAANRRRHEAAFLGSFLPCALKYTFPQFPSRKTRSGAVEDRKSQKGLRLLSSGVRSVELISGEGGRSTPVALLDTPQ